MANVKKTAPRLRKLSVYLYIPNIIGGFLWVFLIVYDYWLHGFDGIFHFYVVNVRYLSVMRVLGAFSFVCDAIDGWCARKFNQVSTFGAVLDMVTDRISTACLLVILSQVYRPGLVFVSLLALDIGSHWLQMYSTFLTGKTNHKDVKDSTNWLFKAYYGNRMFMGYCCVACEVLYLILFLIAGKQSESLVDVGCGEYCATGFAPFLPSCIEFIRMGNQTNDQCHTEESVCGSPARVPTFQCASIYVETGR
ncbi:hypothetical protein WN943_027425 [Citrus x changshan-huyou]